jgi:hypothetical protein
MPLNPLHELQNGAIRTPVTSLFFICAPKVGLPVQPTTEQDDGQVFFANLIQCFCQVPQLQFLFDVPVTFDQPEFGKAISLSLCLTF